MKLYDLYSDKGFHTSVATSFGLDFDAYEAIVLPRLKGAGCRNNIVVPDSRMLTYALSDVSRLPALAGSAYTVIGAAADSSTSRPLPLRSHLPHECAAGFGQRDDAHASIAGQAPALGEAGGDEAIDEARCGRVVDAHTVGELGRGPHLRPVFEAVDDAEGASRVLRGNPEPEVPRAA